MESTTKPAEIESARLAAIIDRGLALHRRIERDKAELKQIERALEDHALNHPEAQQPLEDPERRGRQCIVAGSSASVPVILESDMIIGSCKADSVVADKLRAAAGDALPSFFIEERKLKNHHKTGPAFRAAAVEILGAGPGTKLITTATARDSHGIPKSRTVIAWDRAK